jgi:hypothetical protein
LFWTEEAPADWPEDQEFVAASHEPAKQDLVNWNFSLRQKISDYLDNYHILGSDQEDFSVLVTDKYLREGEELDPTGTIGNLGIFYGLRVSIVPPSGMISAASNTQVDTISRLTKSLKFDDGVLLPIAAQEIGIIDSELEKFDSTSGDNEFDLACLVTRLAKQPEFTLMFDKILGAGSCASLCALYCVSNFESAVGFGSWENKEQWERDPENIELPEFDPDEGYFDGIYNKRVKRYLRREFSSFYLSNDSDGQKPEDMDADAKLMFNPFAGFSLGMLLPKIHLLKLRRLRNYPYDADGNDCADPLQDFL